MNDAVARNLERPASLQRSSLPSTAHDSPFLIGRGVRVDATKNKSPRCTCAQLWASISSTDTGLEYLQEPSQRWRQLSCSPKFGVDTVWQHRKLWGTPSPPAGELEGEAVCGQELPRGGQQHCAALTEPVCPSVYHAKVSVPAHTRPGPQGGYTSLPEPFSSTWLLTGSAGPSGSEVGSARLGREVYMSQRWRQRPETVAGSESAKDISFSLQTWAELYSGAYGMDTQAGMGWGPSL